MFHFWPKLPPPVRPPELSKKYVHDRIILYYSTPWPLRMTPARFMTAGVSDLIELADYFGFPFSSPVEVWLFPTSAALGRYHGRDVAGAACVEHRLVTVGGDLDDPVETLRHELAPLVSASWGGMEPSLKCEGLAVWWEGQPDRKAAMQATRALCRMALQQGPLPELRTMVDENYFHHPSREWLCYALAGSFTGWLIGRHGWVRYREFFRRAGPDNFEAAFEDVFPLNLDAAERRWQMELVPRRGLLGC